MKIAMIGQKGIPTLYGGIERHVEELSAELVSQGHEVLVYARSWYTPKTRSEYKGVKIVHTPTINTKHTDAIIHTLTATIHAMFQKVDVIHYHGVGPSLLSWIPRVFAPQIKVVATFHCIDRYHQKWGALARFMLLMGERAACTFPHRTLAVSKTIQNYCLNEYQRETTFNPNGVSIEPLENEEILTKWNLEPKKYVVMVSRLVKHKGAHYLIEGWKRAQQEAPEIIADHKLVIVGGSSFTDDYVAYLKQISQNDSSIIFTDWQNGAAINALYGHALMLAHPSENEGLPITVLQAMAAGRPALVSDIPEHQEVITDSKFWTANTSVESIKQKLLELIPNKELLEETGRQNLATVKKSYQWSDIATRTIGVYEKPIVCRPIDGHVIETA